jgi:two-component system, OmpR family, osmolarity sensor histidine kinase EnvZ
LLGRLGLAGRLVLILLCLLIVLGLSGISFAWYLRGQDAGVGVRLPLPDQAAAIVDALEAVAATRRDLILRAANSTELRVTVEKERPPPLPIGRRFPVAEWLVGQYIEVMHQRDIEVVVAAEPGTSRWARLFGLMSPVSSLPLRIVVPLIGGDYAVFETRGSPTQRIFGVPTGFWIGVLGALLGLFAIIAIVREAKPLGDLARAVSRFSGEAKPELVASRGAPDVRALIDAVNSMQQRIVGLVKGRTVLLGAVSHDLKTYITRLRLRVEEILDEHQRDKAIRDLDDMAALIDSAIAVARGTPASGLRERFDLAQLIEGEIAERPAARVQLHHPNQPVEFDGDKLGLRRAFGNLIDNALRYAGRCEITIVPGPGALHVLVDDDGPGIPEDARTAVLEPFYRLEGSRSRDTGGSGLGLAIVKQIVESHGGSIEILQSSLGGACVKLTLPMSAAAFPDQTH